MPTTQPIRFLLDGELVEIDDVDPTRTVLEYLREDLRRTGTKEGCAEGDCGACTVVVAELTNDGDDVRLRAINSCIQFLPTLDGKELTTVESLVGTDGSLHPVQQAMVDEHGSQCGFCTPGFVMSLFALYKHNARPTRREIDDALSGNLCRCTGYRPIIAAAQRMADHQPGDDWLRRPGVPAAPKERIDRLRALARDASLTTGDGERWFHAPVTAAELARLLAEYPDATLLAGGTDVGLWVTKQHREFDRIVYTGKVRELSRLEVTDSHLEIGAAVSWTDAMPLLLEHYPLLEELMLRFASPLIRNAGTLGGNVANGSPIGDSMPALIAAGASVVLRSHEGTREVLLEDFYHDYMVNELAEGEFVETVRVPKPPAGAELRSYKISKRFDQDISAVCAGILLELDGDTVRTVRIAFGGMAATVRRASHCEQALDGQTWNEATVDKAMQALARDFTPIDDMRSTADYRLRVAQNLLRRLYLETRGDRVSLYEYGRAG